MRWLVLLLIGCGSPAPPKPKDMGPDLAAVDLRPKYCLSDQDCPPPQRCVGGACAVIK